MKFRKRSSAAGGSMATLAAAVFILLCISLLSSCGGVMRQHYGDSAQQGEESDLQGDPLAEHIAALERGEDYNGNDYIADSFDIAEDQEDLSDGSEENDSVSAEATTSPAKPVGPAPVTEYRRSDLRRAPLAEIFNDSNKYHYAVAERIGIKPIHGVADAYFTRRPLIKITGGSDFALDTLTHSMPYLVPEANRLLHDIGREFNAAVKKHGGSSCRMRVTSLTRTRQAVKRLRRHNVNATDSSTHQFGTTFDISWARFEGSEGPNRIPDEQLKFILAEVLYDMRDKGRCLVKYERKTPCFHITATGK